MNPARRVLLVVLAGLLATSGVSCLGALRKPSPEKQRYVFAVERPGAADAPRLASESPEGEPGGTGVLRVGRVRISPLFERKRFVYRTGDDRYDEDFYHEFYSAPGVLLRQVLLEWLTRSALFPEVIDATDRSRSREQVNWALDTQVEELYGDLRPASGPRAVVAVQWTLYDARATVPEIRFQDVYRAELDAGDGSGEALMEAWNRSLARVLTELEGDLRTFLAR